MLFLKHPAWLWLKKHDKEKLPPVDDNTQAMFDAGHKFEAYAEALFAGGVTLGFSDYNEYRSLTGRTRQALSDGVTTIFQSRFEWGEYNCLPDIMKVVGDAEVDLYEIKSSTRVKDEHLYDLAFQRAVIEANGFAVRKIFVIYVNNTYVRRGEINNNDFTKIDDVTTAVHDLKSFTDTTMPLALETMHSATMPDPNPILLSKLGDKREWQIIYESLVGRDRPDYSGVKPTVQRQKIDAFLHELKFPLYFLDYESVNPAIPLVDGVHPRQQMVFQYSLHILDTSDSEMRHTEHLSREASSAALEALAAQMREDIGDKGSVIVWNKVFERDRNKELAELFPEYASFYESLNTRIYDLMDVFAKNYYVHPGFLGKCSIKYVLPVLVPELSYKDLAIGKGDIASVRWYEIVTSENTSDADQVFADLLAYCKLDTLAMVKIYEHLTSTIRIAQLV